MPFGHSVPGYPMVNMITLNKKCQLYLYKFQIYIYQLLKDPTGTTKPPFNDL